MLHCKFFGTTLDLGDYSQSPLKVIERQKVSLLWADQPEPSIPWLTGNQMGKICSSQLSQPELNQVGTWSFNLNCRKGMINKASSAGGPEGIVEEERTQIRGRKTDSDAADCQREEERRRSCPELGSVIYL